MEFYVCSPVYILDIKAKKSTPFSSPELLFTHFSFMNNNFPSPEISELFFQTANHLWQRSLYFYSEFLSCAEE